MFGKKKKAQKTESVIGIDIGSFSIKAVQVSKKEDGYMLENFGYRRIDPGKLEGTDIAIKALCQDMGLSGRKVNASINADSVIVRYLMLPQMSLDDLKKAMAFEVDRYVPFPKEQIVSDYLPLKTSETAKNMKVLLVAAKKKDVEERVNLLKSVGLEPDVMTIDSIVLKNPFNVNYPEKIEKTIGLINIGSRITNINIVRDSNSYFMRDVQLGGDNITHLLKEKLDMNLEQAEQAKNNLTAEQKEKIKIIEPILGNLLNEIYLSFDYYESEFGMTVDEIIISGGTARLASIADFLKENLNRNVIVFNPLDKIKIASSLETEKITLYKSALVVPLGLAMENFIG